MPGHYNLHPEEIYTEYYSYCFKSTLSHLNRGACWMKSRLQQQTPFSDFVSPEGKRALFMPCETEAISDDLLLQARRRV